MGYGCDIFFLIFAGKFRIANIVFAVSGSKTEFFGNFEPEFKGFFRFFAKGRILFRFAFDARYRNKSSDIAEDIIFVFLDEKVYVFKVDFHFFKISFRFVHS